MTDISPEAVERLLMAQTGSRSENVIAALANERDAQAKRIAELEAELEDELCMSLIAG